MARRGPGFHPRQRFSFDVVDEFLVRRHGLAHVRRVDAEGSNGTPEVRWIESRDPGTDHFKAAAVGRMLRPARPIQGSTIVSWRENGLSVRHADMVADLLGWYPGNLWPEWFGALDAPEQLELIAS